MYINLAHLKYLEIGHLNDSSVLSEIFKNGRKNIYLGLTLSFGAIAFMFKSTSKVCQPKIIFSCFICFELNYNCNILLKWK